MCVRQVSAGQRSEFGESSRALGFRESFLCSARARRKFKELQVGRSVETLAILNSKQVGSA